MGRPAEHQGIFSDLRDFLELKSMKETAKFFGVSPANAYKINSGESPNLMRAYRTILKLLKMLSAKQKKEFLSDLKLKNMEK